MGTHCIGIIVQAAAQQSLHLSVRISGSAGKQLDASLGQGIAGAAADTAANQGLHPVGSQESRQGPVAAAVGVHYLSGHYLAVLHLIDLELLRVPKMLKYLSIVISYCDLHLHSRL